MALVRTIIAVLASIIGIILSLPVLVCGLPFWFVAIITRSISNLIEPKFLPWRQLMEFDQNVGWKPKANLNNYYYADNDDIYHIRTDSLGWPGKTSISESNVVVFGDSFAFGYGVDTDKSFANINPHLRVKAIGTNGYNMVQELLIMRQLSSQIKGKLVIWFVYLENDLYDNLAPHVFYHRNPFVRKSFDGKNGWKIESSHLSQERWSYSSPTQYSNHIVLAKLCTPCLLSKRIYSACDYLIKEGNDVCSQVEAQLVVMTIPNVNQLYKEGVEYLKSLGIDKSLFDPDYPDKVIGEICQKQGVPFLASKKHLSTRDYKEFEKFHWNENGHRRVSELLTDLYDAYMSDTLRATTECNKAIHQ